MTPTVTKGNRVHFPGDSITQFGWFSAVGGLVDQINANWTQPPDRIFPGVPSGSSAILVNGATPATVRATTPARPSITVTSSGVIGNTTQDIAADISGRITNFNPDLVILEVGLNDWLTQIGQPAFQTAMGSILDTTIAWKPSVQIIVLSIFVNFESWLNNTPITWATQVTTPINQGYNATAKALCDARPANCLYVDINTPALNYEVAHNTPAPGVTGQAGNGFLTGDGWHPTLTGQLLMGSTVYSAITVVP